MTSKDHFLRKLDSQMGKAEYDMYRAIPAEELGVENPQHHMTYNEWRAWLEKEIAQTEYSTYIMYSGEYPIGHVTISTNEDIEGGNLSYVIRPVCRGAGLAKIMLKLAIDEARKLGIGKLVGFVSKYNVASQSVMEDCDFTPAKDTERGLKCYEFRLEEE